MLVFVCSRVCLTCCHPRHIHIYLHLKHTRVRLTWLKKFKNATSQHTAADKTDAHDKTKKNSFERGGGKGGTPGERGREGEVGILFGSWDINAAYAPAEGAPWVPPAGALPNYHHFEKVTAQNTGKHSQKSAFC